MNRGSYSKLAFAALVVLLGAQVASRQGRPDVALLAGPTVGGMFPDAAVQFATSDRPQALASFLDGHCSLVVGINTGCSVCRRMRVTWPRQFRAWSDSIDVPIVPIWLSGEDDVDVQRFYQGRDFSGITLLNVALNGAAVFQRLGVHGTPTTYVIGSDRRLRLGLIGDQLPPAALTNQICVDPS